MNLPPPSANQARLIWYGATALAVAVMLALLGLAVWGLGWMLHALSAVLLPATLALILAYILDPVVEALVRKKIKRFWAILLVFIAGLMVAGGVLGSVVPGMLREIHGLFNDLPRNPAAMRLKLNEFLEHSPLIRQIPGLWQTPGAAGVTNPTPVISPWTSDSSTNDAAINAGKPGGPAAGPPPDSTLDESSDTGMTVELSEDVMVQLSEVLKNALKWLASQLGKMTTWAEFLVGFILVPVYLFYFLLEKQRITRGWTRYLPLNESKAKEEVVFVLNALNDCMVVFFRGQVLVALCVGALLTVGYLLMGLKYAVLLGATAAVLGIVPYLGTITTLLLALTVAAVQFGDWTHPLLVLALAALVKLLEDLVIGPKIIGDRSGLHPLAIIVAVMVGTTLLGGVLGALFAIPLAAVLRTLMFRYVWKHRPAPPPPQPGPAGI